MHFFWIYILLHVILNTGTTRAVEKCSRNYTCVSMSECNMNPQKDNLFYPCEDRQKICCPIEFIRFSTKLAEFPQDCGEASNSDRITGGENATIRQFPWMVLLGYKTGGIDIIQFLCGGSLISENYVLTAAHCLAINNPKLSLARLGELDLTKNRDCISVFNKTECADPHYDIPVANVVIHEDFNKPSLKNDIGLIKLATKVTFTDFVLPICLPYSTKKNLTDNKKLTISGWGKTQADNFGGSSILQYARIFLWESDRCEKFLTSEVKPLEETQICGIGKNAEDACKGDSGGPLFVLQATDAILRNYQVGIISFSSTPTCGNIDLPTIYTRVDKYLDWISLNAV